MKERTSVVVEEYLQIIYHLISDAKPVKAVTLTKLMKSSPSTVHATLSRLQRDNLVVVNKKKEIALTTEGREQAESLTRRHRLVESFLCDTLGISWHEVHKHAHIMEHGLTPLVEEKLAEFLGFPKSCPHGTPIPGENNQLPDNMTNLIEFSVGDRVEIIIIDESMEDSLDVMKFLQDKNIRPGVYHRIIEKLDVTKTIVLQAENGENSATLPYNIARKIGAVKLT